MAEGDRDWTKPAAWRSRRRGTSNSNGGGMARCSPTPACHGFSIIAKVKEGREDTVRAYEEPSRRPLL